MKDKAIVMSLLAAAIAVFFVSSYVTSIEEKNKKIYGTEVLVVKANKDIREQETINETVLELAAIPKRYLEPSAISFQNVNPEDKETQKSMKTLVGTVALVPIKKGEQITFNKVTEPSIRTGLASQIAPGRRAVSLPITETTGVAKLIKPGDRVDVIAIIKTGVGAESRIGKTLFQDVSVLAVGQSVTNNIMRLVELDPVNGRERVKSLTEDSSFNTITIELEPAQAQVMSFIASNSENIITLTLRNADDTDRVNFETLSLEDVVGSEFMRRGVAGRRGGQ